MGQSQSKVAHLPATPGYAIDFYIPQGAAQYHKVVAQYGDSVGADGGNELDGFIFLQGFVRVFFSQG